jgi:hypothetical protein
MATLCKLLNEARQTLVVTAASNKAVCVVATEYLKLIQYQNPFTAERSEASSRYTTYRQRKDRDITGYCKQYLTHRCVLVGVEESIAFCMTSSDADDVPRGARSNQHSSGSSLGRGSSFGSKSAHQAAKHADRARPHWTGSDLNALYKRICEDINALYYPTTLLDIYVYRYSDRVAQVLGDIFDYIKSLLERHLDVSSAAARGGEASPSAARHFDSIALDLRKICVELRNVLENVINTAPDTYQMYMWNIAMKLESAWRAVFDMTEDLPLPTANDTESGSGLNRRDYKDQLRDKPYSIEVVKLVGDAEVARSTDGGTGGFNMGCALDANLRILMNTISELQHQLSNPNVCSCIHSEYISSTSVLFCTLSTAGSNIVRNVIANTTTHANTNIANVCFKTSSRGFLSKKRFNRQQQRHQQQGGNSLTSDDPSDGSSCLVGRKIDYLIVDEAAQVLEPELSIGLCLQPANVVLIGDPQQLPPFVVSTEIDRGLRDFGGNQKKFDNRDGSRANMNSVQASNTCAMSAMQRLMYKDDSSVKFNVSSFVDGVVDSQVLNYRVGVMLNKQYRMHPEILSFPNALCYDSRLTSCDSVINRMHCLQLQAAPLRPAGDRSAECRLPEWLQHYAFIDVSDGFEQQDGSKSTFNPAEADLIVL